jgi:acyl-[acyl-carrier-protein] desaturase
LEPFDRTIEVLRDLEPLIGRLRLAHEQRADSWSPSAFLPRPYVSDDAPRVRELQERARGIPPAARACLALNMVTEEGLPLFHRILRGALPAGGHFFEWLHQWTAEEDRHGLVIRRYVALTGVLDEIELDRMQFAFVRSGWEPGWDADPYGVFVYTSLQERATQVAHTQTAALAQPYEPILSDFLKTVARDEARHYAFYRSVFKAVLERDPDAALASASRIMPLMAMPGGSMPQFRELAEVASRAGVYTLRHYRDIVIELNRFWELDTVTPVTDCGKRTRDRLLAIPDRLTRIADKKDAVRTARAFQFPVAFGHEFVL